MIAKLQNFNFECGTRFALPNAVLWENKVWERNMPNYLRDLAKHHRQLEEIKRKAERFGRPKTENHVEEESDIETGGSLAGNALFSGVLFLAGGVAGASYFSMQIIGIFGFVIFSLFLIFFLFRRQRELENLQKRRERQVREFHMKKGDPKYWGRGDSDDT